MVNASSRLKTIRTFSLLGDLLVNKMKFSWQDIKYDEGTGIAFTNPFMDIVATITDIRGESKIKIEYIEVHREYRSRGLASSALKSIMNLCEKERVCVGFWVDIDDMKKVRWYESLGFKHIETVDDHWLEYIPSDRYKIIEYPYSLYDINNIPRGVFYL